MSHIDKLEEKLSDCIHGAINDRVFSGCCCAIAQGNKALLKNFGTVSWEDQQPVGDNTFFDLASLTKPLATTLAILVLLSQKTIDLDDYLTHLLETKIPADKAQITLFHLLNHCSGLAGHRHFYKILEKIPHQERKKELLRLVLAEPLDFLPGTKAVYSDLGFILLGLIVETKAELNLEDAVRKYVYEPLGLDDKLLFNPKEKGIATFAATEQCPWRQRLLRGEVDDQNTWVIGGVSGQAGLFGTGKDVLDMVKKITEIASGARKHPYIDQHLLKRAMCRQGEIKASSWGLGFDTPSDTGSSAGQFISRRSCGHLGFTGTSFWHDFDKDITVVLLTNRIHPSVDNDKIKVFRPKFHDLVFGTLA
ncbi:MAG: beta-lactamase family protein [Proteobacteria bacterium]|nr:beta-lactamase family protein [Pseudomonadota bacterium]